MQQIEALQLILSQSANKNGDDKVLTVGHLRNIVNMARETFRKHNSIDKPVHGSLLPHVEELKTKRISYYQQSDHYKELGRKMHEVVMEGGQAADRIVRRVRLMQGTWKTIQEHEQPSEEETIAYNYAMLVKFSKLK